MTAVQAILVSTFNQDIHVVKASPAPPPGHAPKSYTVSGAGDAAWNGVYTLDVDQAESADSVKGDGLMWTQSTNRKHQLYKSMGAWRLAVRAQAVYYLASGESGRGGLPPLTGWLVESAGKAPAPMLIAGPSNV